jgi:hypothetical protein
VSFNPLTYLTGPAFMDKHRGSGAGADPAS